MARKICTKKRARKGLCTPKRHRKGHGRRRIAPCGRKANGQIKKCGRR